MKHLSLANYRVRKAQIQGHLKDAEEAHGEVALQFEIGEVDQAAVDASRAAVTALKDSMEALEAAFRRSQDAEARAEREAAADRRRKAIATAEECLEERLAAAKAVEDAGAALDAATARWAAANERFRRTVSPAIQEVRRGYNVSDLIPYLSREVGIIQQRILTEIDTPRATVPISEIVASANENVRQRLEILLGDDEDEREAA